MAASAVRDLERWKVRGLVRTLRSEAAAWYGELQDWKTAAHFQVTTFREDGALLSIAAHNPDGSVAYSRWLYDGAGRLVETNFQLDAGAVTRTVRFYDDEGRHHRTATLDGDGVARDVEATRYGVDGRRMGVRFLSPAGTEICTEICAAAHSGHAVEGTDAMYGAPGAATMTTTYDEGDRPAGIEFHDAQGRLLSAIALTRNPAGNVVQEVQRQGERSPYQGLLDGSAGEEQLMAALAALFGDGLSSTTYEYDERGRRVLRETRLGTLSRESTVYRYDVRDEPVEETTTRETRGGYLNEDEGLRYASAQVTVQHTRLTYSYDATGNWTERKVASRSEGEAEFRSLSRDTRVFGYYST